MHATCYGLEIVDGERPGIEVSIPAYGIERVGSVGEGIHHSLLFNHDFEVAFFIMRFEVHGLADVALAVGGMFEELPVFIAVSLRGNYRGMGFYNQEAVVGTVEFYLINCASWDDQVIAIGEFDAAIDCFQSSGADMDKNYFIGIGILIEIIFHGIQWRGEANIQIVIDENMFAALQIIILGSYHEADETFMIQMPLIGDFWFDGIGFADVFNHGRRVGMID